MRSSLPFPLPPAAAVLLRSRAEALEAFTARGWGPWVTPIGLDAERRRLLNVDLTEPEVAFQREGELLAVAHLEADRAGRVTLVEITATAAVPPEKVAEALLEAAGEPQLSGGADARQWVWGPEAGGAGALHGEPLRLWVCQERAYGDRLWAVLGVVRRG